jgi:hypothetical protein
MLEFRDFSQVLSLSFLVFSVASFLGTFRFLGYSSFISPHTYFTSLASQSSFLLIGLSIYFIGSVYEAENIVSVPASSFSPLSVRLDSILPPSAFFGAIFFGLILFSELFRRIGLHSFLSFFSLASSLLGLALIAFRSFTFLLLEPVDPEYNKILGLSQGDFQYCSILLLLSVLVLLLGRFLSHSLLGRYACHPTTAFHLSISLTCVLLHSAAQILLFPPQHDIDIQSQLRPFL